MLRRYGPINTITQREWAHHYTHILGYALRVWAHYYKDTYAQRGWAHYYKDTLRGDGPIITLIY